MQFNNVETVFKKGAKLRPGLEKVSLGYDWSAELKSPHTGTFFENLLAVVCERQDSKYELKVLESVLNLYLQMRKNTPEIYGKPLTEQNVQENLDNRSQFNTFVGLSDPTMWNVVKNVADFLKDNRLTLLCNNTFPDCPKYIVEKRLKELTHEGWSNLFKNASAVEPILKSCSEGKISPETVTKYGAQYPHFTRYFDATYCDKVLNGTINNPEVVLGLIKNREAAVVVEKYFTAIETFYPKIFPYIAEQPHLLPIIKANLPKFYNGEGRMHLNWNIGAINILREYPYLIHWPSLALNPEAMPLLKSYFQMRVHTSDKMFEMALRSLNENPAAVDFLIANPKLIRHSIVTNQGIFGDTS